jgi:PPM family protein phosphatase
MGKDTISGLTSMALEFHALSDVGCARRVNEDRTLIDPSLGLYAVCDGMGGHRNGATAAELAIAGLHYYMGSSSDLDATWPFGYNLEMSLNANRMATGIRIANRQVWGRAGEDPACAGMGTTVVAVLVEGSTVTIGNVGDSRAYLFREGRLAQLTIDDTVIGDLRGQGLLDAREAHHHPARNMLTRAAGAGEDVEVHIRDEELRPNDMLLLSSDGLHGVVDQSTIETVLASGERVERCLRRLIEEARSLGAPDNVSGVLLRWVE